MLTSLRESKLPDALNKASSKKVKSPEGHNKHTSMKTLKIPGSASSSCSSYSSLANNKPAKNFKNFDIEWTNPEEINPNENQVYLDEVWIL